MNDKKKIINILVLIIAVIAVATSIFGIFSGTGEKEREFISVFGEKITLHGKGIYKNDSISTVSQGVAQDYVTLILGVGLLLFSLYKYNKGTLKGNLLLLGTLGFFLYTYMSYTFLWFYNDLFLLYVTNMSCSLFAFILLIMSIDVNNLKENFDKKLPTKLLGGFQIFIGIAMFMLWMGKIVPSLINGKSPVGLDHYTTLVIQGMDLGFLVPLAIISGTLLIKKNNYGYLFSSLVIIKGASMLTSLSAMIVGQIMAGVNVSIVEMIMFPAFNIFMFICLYLLIKNIKNKI